MFNTDKAFALLKEKHVCPFCNSLLTLCEEPDTNFADGLGWGGFLYICLNDDCRNIETTTTFKKIYSDKVFTRYAFLPGETRGFSIPVYSLDSFKQLVINKEELVASELARLNGIESLKMDQMHDSFLEHKRAKENVRNFIKEHTVNL